MTNEVEYFKDRVLKKAAALRAEGALSQRSFEEMMRDLEISFEGWWMDEDRFPEGSAIAITGYNPIAVKFYTGWVFVSAKDIKNGLLNAMEVRDAFRQHMSASSKDRWIYKSNIYTGGEWKDL